MPTNRFQRFYDLGYRRLCPIVPPGAPLSEKSSLAMRMRKDAGKDPRGKAPGVLVDGLWQGINFVRIESEPHHLVAWDAMGAGVGIKTGEGLHLIDADTLDAHSAKIVERIIRERIGPLPVRIGQWPKVGYLIQTEIGFAYTRVEFGKRNDRGELVDRVEILGDGRQFVADGVHPKTGKPYDWPNGVPPLADVPRVTHEALRGLMTALAEALPAAAPPIVEGGSGEAPPQERLRGDPDLVRKAIEALPNDSERFGSREKWRDVGYALRASLPDDPALALELFQDWSAKWEEGTELDENGHLIVGNDPDYVAAEFARMKPPYRRGADWLYEIAERESGGAFKSAERWLDEETEKVEPLFPPEEGTADARRAAGEDVSGFDEYKLLTLGDLMRMPDPKFLIDRHVRETGTGILFGAPGTGKTFITLDASLSIAFAFERWHGDPINLNLVDGLPEKVCVIYLAGEGAPGFKPRTLAWRQQHGIPEEAWESGRFAIIDESVNFMKVEDIDKIVRTLKRRTGCRVALIVVDTVSRVLPGADENLQKDMTLFVAACRRLEQAFGCAVWGVHHTNKGGDMRGSSVFEGAGDFIFKLERDKGARVGKLHCVKMKDGGADGWSENYKFDVVSIAGTADPQGRPLTSLVISRCEIGEAAVLGGLTPDKVEAVFEAIQKAGEAGEPWSLRQNVKGGARFYQTRMLHDFKIDRATAESAMDTWIAEGRIREDVPNKKSRSRGLVVTPYETKIPQDETKLRSVFD